MMNKSEKNKIIGKRIYLKKLDFNEIDSRVLDWFENSDLMKYYTNSKRKITKLDLEKSIKQGELNENNYTYGIYTLEKNVLIGTIKLGPINLAHKISDLVVLLGDTDYHGKGYSVEAIELGNKLAFEVYDIRKLFGGMYESNIASIKAYTRAGWVIEGRLKGHYLEGEMALDRVLVGCFNPKYFPFKKNLND